MIIVINSQGKVVAQQSEDLYQGSVNANVIELVAPFADNVIFKANIELPDGTLLPENLDGYVLKKSIKIIDGLNVWKLPIEYPVSKNYGTITIQLRGEVGNQIVCSSTIKIPIQKGVPYNKNQDLEPTLYDQVLQMIGELRAVVGNKVDIVNTEYIKADVTEDTVGYFYVFDIDTDQYVQVVLPEQFESGRDYYTAGKIGRVVNGTNGVFFEYFDGEKTTKVELFGDRVAINNKTIATFDDLIAEKIAYDNKNSKLLAENLQEAVDKLVYSVDDLENSKTVDIGDYIIPSNAWTYNDGIYQYKFKNALLTDALYQGVIITPNKETTDNLNANDVLVYAEVNTVQEGENVAVAILEANKKPDFNMTVNVKIQGTSITSQTKGITADQIAFVPNNQIASKTVQKAVEEVQTNINAFKTEYNTEKTEFVKTDERGKISASLLPSFVDDVVEGYLHETQFYATKEDDVYSDVIPAVSGKVYVDLDTNKTYRWSGSQYTVIKGDLSIGTTQGTAYDGASGQNLSNIINEIITGTRSVGNAINAVSSVGSEFSLKSETSDYATTSGTAEFAETSGTSESSTEADHLKSSSTDYLYDNNNELYNAFKFKISSNEYMWFITKSENVGGGNTSRTFTIPSEHSIKFASISKYGSDNSADGSGFLINSSGSTITWYPCNSHGRPAIILITSV